MSRELKFDPMTVNPSDIPEYANLPSEKAERKMETVRDGAIMAREEGAFPPRRQCADCCWGLLFLLTVVALITSAAYYANYYLGQSSANINSNTIGQMCSLRPLCDHPECQWRDGRCQSVYVANLWTLGGAGLAGGCFSIITAFFYCIFAKLCPACVVYTALFISSALMVLSGIAMIATGQTFGQTFMVTIGAIIVAVGVFYGFCALCCWRKYVPFMIELTEVVASVITEHPGMMFISLVGGFLALVWTLACSIAVMGIYTTHYGHMQNYDMDSKADGKGTRGAAFYTLVFCAFFVFAWGAQVCHNVCHTTFAGVFGRWYFNATTGRGVTCSSLKVALTTSFGSICFGSFLVAVIGAAEQVSRSARQGAQEEGNFVTCIIAGIIECIIACIGDIVEYFNEWAFIQCAIRGATFCEAAKITLSLMTCSNATYIVQDLLLSSLVTMGCMLCGFVGCVSGGLFGYLMSEANGGHVTPITASGMIIGFIIGILAGSSACTMIPSGIKTILMCWAENPSFLEQSHPEVAAKFNEKVQIARGMRG